MHYTRNMFIMVTVVTMVGVSAYVFVFLGVRNTNQDAAAIGLLIGQELAKQNQHDSLQTLSEDTQAEREELLGRVIAEDSLVRFFEEIETLAAEADVAMEIVRIQEHVELEPVILEAKEGEEKPKPKPHPAAGELEWLQMDVAVTGSWWSAYRFLSFVELMPYEISLANIQLELRDADIQVAPVVTPGVDGEPDDTLTTPSGDMWGLTFTAKILRIKE